MSRYSFQQKWHAYTKAEAIPGSDDRIDCDGRRIRWSEYGERASQFGWEVDHFPVPQCDNGPDELWNLRARHCTGNAMAGGLLGAFRRDEPKGILGGAFETQQRNAMAIAREYSNPQPRNAMANALMMDLPPLPPHLRR